MRLPLRRDEKNRPAEDTEFFVTAPALERMKRDLHDLEKVQRPQAAEDKKRAAALGDLSENAEYMEAKARLARINTRILSLTDRIARAVLIEATESDAVQLGSTVVLQMGDNKKTYQLVGPFETDPARGRISHKSPLGEALLGKRVGDTVSLKTPTGTQQATILALS